MSIEEAANTRIGLATVMINVYLLKPLPKRLLTDFVATFFDTSQIRYLLWGPDSEIAVAY
jgi:hypothetical protein